MPGAAGGAGGGHGGGGMHIHIHARGVHSAVHTAAHANKIGHVQHAHCGGKLKSEILAWLLMQELKHHHMSIPLGINALA